MIYSTGTTTLLLLGLGQAKTLRFVNPPAIARPSLGPRPVALELTERILCDVMPPFEGRHLQVQQVTHMPGPMRLQTGTRSIHGQQRPSVSHAGEPIITPSARQLRFPIMANER